MSVDGRVGLLVTCLIDLVRPRIGFAALRLLEAAGCEVTVPASQTCCGQPGWNSGDRPSARALARKVIEEFEPCAYVVAPSGSCAGMVRVHYPALFPDDGAWLERAERLAAKTWELTDFLVYVARFDQIPGEYAGTVTYHDSCAGLRELGVQQQPRALMAKMRGVQLKEMREAETCCGFGGTFSVKFGEISAAMAKTKCDHVHASGAGAVVLGDLGCMLNIEGKLRRMGDDKTRVLHVAELLTWEK
jgi:L-lactate dehydrogenase complex protein LldE